MKVFDKPVIWSCASYHLLHKIHLETFIRHTKAALSCYEIVDEYRSFSWKTIVSARDDESLFADSNKKQYVLLDVPSHPDRAMSAEGVSVIRDWLQAPNPATLFIRAPHYSYRVTGLSWYKELKSTGIIHELQAPGQTTHWIANRAIDRGITLDKHKIADLAARFGGDLDAIENQLSLFALLPQADIATPPGHCSLMEFGDALEKKQPITMLQLLDSYEKQKEDRMAVFGIISAWVTKQFRIATGVWRGNTALPQKNIFFLYNALHKLEAVVKGQRGNLPPWIAIKAYIERLGVLLKT